MEYMATPQRTTTLNPNDVLRFCAKRGTITVVEKLLADPRVDSVSDLNGALRDSAANGHAEVVKLLLADARVDPACFDDDALRFSALRGHTGVVELLLADPRVDPAALENYAIRTSAMKQHTEVVQLLCLAPRVCKTTSLATLPPFVRTVWASMLSKAAAASAHWMGVCKAVFLSKAWRCGVDASAQVLAMAFADRLILRDDDRFARAERLLLAMFTEATGAEVAAAVEVIGGAAVPPSGPRDPSS